MPLCSPGPKLRARSRTAGTAGLCERPPADDASVRIRIAAYRLPLSRASWPNGYKHCACLAESLPPKAKMKSEKVYGMVTPKECRRARSARSLLRHATVTLRHPFWSQKTIKTAWTYVWGCSFRSYWQWYLWDYARNWYIGHRNQGEFMYFRCLLVVFISDHPGLPQQNAFLGCINEL